MDGCPKEESNDPWSGTTSVYNDMGNKYSQMLYRIQKEEGKHCDIWWDNDKDGDKVKDGGKVKDGEKQWHDDDDDKYWNYNKTYDDKYDEGKVEPGMNGSGENFGSFKRTRF